MKRVLTFATTGLFMTGLALLPMSVRADQTVTGGKTAAPAASTMTPSTAPGASGAQTSTAPVKKDDKKVTPGSTTTVAPSGSGPVSPGTTVKTPAKGS